MRPSRKDWMKGPSGLLIRHCSLVLLILTTDVHSSHGAIATNTSQTSLQVDNGQTVLEPSLDSNLASATSGYVDYNATWLTDWYKVLTTTYISTYATAAMSFFPLPAFAGGGMVNVLSIFEAADQCHELFNGSLPLITSETDALLFRDAFKLWLSTSGASTSTAVYLANSRW